MLLSHIHKNIPLPAALKETLSSAFKIGIENTPKYALMPFSLLPQRLQENILTKALNYLFSRELAEDELDFLLDKHLRIAITDVHYQCVITVKQDKNKHNNLQRCQVKLQHNQTTNVDFEADSRSLLQLFGQTVDPDTLFSQRKLLITGDTELGLEIKNFLDDLDHDALPIMVTHFLKKYKTLKH